MYLNLILNLSFVLYLRGVHITHRHITHIYYAHLKTMTGGEQNVLWVNKSSNDVTSAILVWKTLDNNDLNQVVASSGCNENKGLGGLLSLTGS